MSVPFVTIWYHKEKEENINSIELEDPLKYFSNMHREASHDSEPILKQSIEGQFDDPTSPTFQSDPLPKKITPLNEKFNVRGISREWVMQFKDDGVELLANIHKRVVFKDEVADLTTSTTEDNRIMDCEESTSSHFKRKPMKALKPLNSSYNNRNISSDWVKEYKEEGTELITDLKQKDIFGNDMEGELTAITPNGLPKVPSQTVSKSTDTKASVEQTENSLLPTFMVKSLKSVRFGRMSSRDWVLPNILDDNDDDTRLTEMFPELTEESDLEHQALSKLNQPCDTPQPSNIPPSVPSSADTIKEKPKNDIPDKQYTEKDVLFGRGGRGNHHKGNKRYRSLVNSHKKQYRKTKDKQAKTAIARLIVHTINASGGRFLRFDTSEKKWVEVPIVRARTKVSQALRE